MKKTLKVAIVTIAAMLVVGVAAGFALAGHASPRATLGATALTPGSYTIKTTLNTKLEVPRPKGTTTATGSFTGTLKVVNASKSTLTYKLTYAHLTGKGWQPTSISARPARPARSSSRSAHLAPRAPTARSRSRPLRLSR